MQTKWYSNLPKAEQDQFKSLVKGSQKVLDRLHEICYNIVKGRELTSESDFENPSWAFREAYRQGYVKAYQEVMSLVKISDQE